MTTDSGERGERVGGASTRAAPRLAWSLCALGLAVLTASLVLIVLGWSTSPPRGGESWWDLAVSLVGVVGAPVLGGLIASRRPRNPYGWLWLGFALGLALQQLGRTYAAYYSAPGPGSPLVAPHTIPHLLAAGGTLSLALAPFLLLLFPTGRLPSRRWRPVAWISALCGTALVVLNLIYARPDQVEGAVSYITVLVATPVMASIVLSGISLIFRYRRASGVERQQLKWFALVALLIGVYIVVGGLLGFERSLSEAGWNVLDAAVNVGLYFAVGVAILRYRLYDVDVIINRALVYGPLTISLIALYFGAVVALQRLFVVMTGERSTLAVVASTLAIAALFSPLRRRTQAFIDKRFYRKKYDMGRTLEVLSARLRDETDLSELGEHLEGAVRDAMQPSHVSVWLRPPPGPERHAR